MSDDHVPPPLPHRSRRREDLGRIVQFTGGGLFCAFLVILGGITDGVGGIAAVAFLGLCVAAFSWFLHRLAARG